MYKAVLTVVAVFLLLWADVAQAAGGNNVTLINQRRGLFGRLRSTDVLSVNSGGGVNFTSIRNRGLFGNRTRIQSFNSGGGAAFISRSRGRSRGRGSSAAIVDNRRFNSFAFNGRFNTFGSSTFVDGFGNIFQVDQFGNTQFLGNTLTRGFSGGFSSSFSSSFHGGFHGHGPALFAPGCRR